MLQSLGAGVHGGSCTVVNFGTGTITFDVSGTSHVADGTSDVIQPNTAQMYVWDYMSDLWYPC